MKHSFRPTEAVASDYDPVAWGDADDERTNRNHRLGVIIGSVAAGVAVASLTAGAVITFLNINETRGYGVTLDRTSIDGELVTTTTIDPCITEAENLRFTTPDQRLIQVDDCRQNAVLNRQAPTTTQPQN